MDVHPGLGDATADDVADAHRRDLAVQDKYGVRYLTYWFSDPDGKAFCLVDAPDVEAAVACHKEAHGLIPNEVIEVATPTLAQFLGEWETDSSDRAMLNSQEPDTGLRAIVFTDIEGSTDISTTLGDSAAMVVVRRHNEIVRDGLAAHGGREVKHTGDGILASFVSVTGAVEASIEIQRRVAESEQHDLAIKLGISAGEPVQEGEDLFGAAVNLAARICAHARGGQILVSGTVRGLAIGKNLQFHDRGAIGLKGFPDAVQLFEVDWSN